MRGHVLTQTAQEFAKGGARPRNAVISLDDLEHLVLGVVGGPVAYTFGQSRGGQARFDPQA